MGIFKKLFGGDKAKPDTFIDPSRFAKLDKTNFSTFEELVEQHAGLSFEKQMIFGEVIGGNAWELNMGKGSISFGRLEFPIQIIGSLAFSNYSWMWGWANSQSGMPKNLLKLSNQLKEIGENNNIHELTEGHFNVDEGFEHKMGMVACGLFKAKSYYCANYGQGTLVVTIDDTKIPTINLKASEKVLTHFPQLIEGVDLNHKNAFQNYLIDREFKLNISDQKIEGLKDKSLITAQFDQQDRLISLKSK